MPGALAEILAIALLAATLAAAVLRPAGLSEAIVAAPAAIVTVAVGLVPLHAALTRLREIGPTVGFLAAILLFGHLCADAGVFDYLGARAARASRSRPRRLLLVVVVLAAAVTAVLTLDATVVLLTPVVLATATALGARHRPHLYACARLANSGSLLLPISNLTNLLAFGASGLSFGRFAALMTLPWLCACAMEWAALRTYFADDLPPQTPAAGTRGAPPPAAPRFALTVLVALVVALGLSFSVHVAAGWIAAAGCLVMLVPRARRRDVDVPRLIAEASPGFCLFVLGLAVVVEGVTRHGLRTALIDMLPAGTGFLALLAIAGLGAALANLANNLPATLALVPLLAGRPAAVLALLVGVNVGPNATYAGSLATLLWRRRLPEADRPRSAQFHRLGLAATPAVLVVSLAALWLALRVLGT